MADTVPQPQQATEPTTAEVKEKAAEKETLCNNKIFLVNAQGVII